MPPSLLAGGSTSVSQPPTPKSEAGDLFDIRRNGSPCKGARNKTPDRTSYAHYSPSPAVGERSFGPRFERTIPTRSSGQSREQAGEVGAVPTPPTPFASRIACTSLLRTRPVKGFSPLTHPTA